MAEIWMYFHKAKDVVRCNGCAYESPNTRTNPANVDALWTHLSYAHRDVYERSNHYATLGSTDVKKVFQSSSNLPSEVWKYFEKMGDGHVRCMLCSHEIAHKHSGRTSAFWRHLKSHHVETYRTTDYFKARPERNRDVEMLVLVDCLEPVSHSRGAFKRPAPLETALLRTPPKRSRRTESDGGDNAELDGDDSGLFEEEDEEQPSDNEDEEDFDEDEEQSEYEVEDESDIDDVDEQFDEEVDHGIEEILSCIYSNTVFTLLDRP